MTHQYFSPTGIRANRMKIKEYERVGNTSNASASRVNFNIFFRRLIPDSMQFHANIKFLASKSKEQIAASCMRIIRSINTAIPASAVKGWWLRTNNRIYRTGDVFYEWMDEFVLMSEIRDERSKKNEPIGHYAETPVYPARQFNICHKNLYRHLSRTYEMFC